MTKSTDKAVTEQGDLVAQANEEIFKLQQQLATLTEQNVALQQANGDLSNANEEKAETIKQLAAQANDLTTQVRALLEENSALRKDIAVLTAPTPIVAPALDPEDYPEEVHAALAADPTIVAAAGLANGTQPDVVRRKLLEAGHRIGAFLEGGIFHNTR